MSNRSIPFNQYSEYAKRHNSLHKQLGISIDEFVLQLGNQYNYGLSINDVACRFGVNAETMRHYFNKYNIRRRTQLETSIMKANRCTLTNNEIEVLNGLMLGDGHLDANACSARLTYGCKFEATLSSIVNNMPSLKFSKPWESKASSCYHFKSNSYRDLLDHQKRWYINKKKIVPPYLRLTSATCYWWFIGDGYKVDHGLQLCTDAFDPLSTEMLVRELSRIGLQAIITKSNNRIRVCGQYATRFLEWIKRNVKIQDEYLYKWENHRKSSICPNVV